MKIILILSLFIFYVNANAHDVVYETTHLNKLVSIKSSQDDRYFLTASISGNVKVWHRKTLKTIRILKNNQSLVFSDFYKNDIIFNLYKNSTYSFYSISKDSILFKGKFNEEFEIEIGFIDVNNKLIFANKDRILIYDLVDILNKKFDKIEYNSKSEMSLFEYDGEELLIYMDSKVYKYDIKRNSIFEIFIDQNGIDKILKNNNTLSILKSNTLNIFNKNANKYVPFEVLNSINNPKSDKDKIYSISDSNLDVFDEYGNKVSSVKCNLESVNEYYVCNGIILFYNFKNYEMEIVDIKNGKNKIIDKKFGNTYRIYCNNNEIKVTEDNRNMYHIDFNYGKLYYYNKLNILNSKEMFYINDTISISSPIIKVSKFENNLIYNQNETKVFKNDDGSFRILNTLLNIDLISYELSGDLEIESYENKIFINDKLFGLFEVINNKLVSIIDENNLNIVKVDDRLYIFGINKFYNLNLLNNNILTNNLKSDFKGKRIYKINNLEKTMYLISNNELFSFMNNSYIYLFKFDVQGQIIDFTINNKYIYIITNMGEILVYDINKKIVIRKIFLGKDGNWLALDENDNFDGTDNSFNNLNIIVDNYPMGIENYINIKYIPQLLTLNTDFSTKTITIKNNNNYKYELNKIANIKVLLKNYDTVYNNKINIPFSIETENIVKELDIYLNGKLFKYKYFKIPVKLNNIFLYPFYFKSGENIIEIQTVNSNDVKSNKIKIKIFCNTEKKLPSLFVLGIANNSYKGMPDLNWPDKDVNDITNSLNNNKYYDKVNISKLSNNFNQNDIIERISYIRKQIKPEDTFIFYYSGHGSYSLKDGFSIVSNDALININIILDQMIDLKSSNIVFMFDACYSGGAIDNLLEFTRALRLYQNKTKISLFSSSYSYQESYEFPKYSNGLFTRVILDLLNKNGTDENKFKHISTYDLDYYIKEKYSIEMKSFDNSKINFNEPIIFSQNKVILK